MRTCAGCGRKAPQHELQRFHQEGGQLVPGAGVGRGVYTCRRLPCFERAATRRAFSRILRRDGASLPRAHSSLHWTLLMANGKPNRPIRPRGGGPKGRRRVVIDQGGGRPGQGQRQRPGDRSAERTPRQPREVAAPSGPATVESGVTLRDFSQALGVAMPQIIKLLMNLGTMKTATQSLTDDEVS